MGNYSLTKIGVSRYDWADPYRVAVALSWRSFLLGLAGAYLTVNLIFALAYLALPGSIANARPHAFADAFFFSFETLATVGYGEMYPATLYGHIVAAAEVMCGIAFTAIMTGLIFVRFSRPRPKFFFAKNPIVTTHNGQRTLMVRVGNGRATTLADARAKISVLMTERSKEENSFRRTHELALTRDHIPVFPLTWTLMHEINEHSPLFGLDPKHFEDADTRMFVSLEARDPELATIVHDVRNYDRESVLFGVRYTDMIFNDAQGNTTADMNRIDDVEPEARYVMEVRPEALPLDSVGAGRPQTP